MKRLGLFFLLLSVISCQDTFEVEFPSVFTGEVTSVDASTALFSGKIENSSAAPVIESGFIWGVHSNDDNGIKIINDGPPTGIFNLETNYSLLPNKTYYVRAYAKTDQVTVYGREVSFNSAPGNINTGEWTKIVWENHGGNSEYIRSSFSLNGITYFLFEDASIYSYNHASNEFIFLQDNDICRSADYSIVHNDNVYTFSKNRFYKFSPDDIAFTPLSIWPNDDRFWITGFLVDDNIYIGLGQESGWQYVKEFWCYNITSDAWKQVADFPGDFRANAYSLSLETSGYVGGGYNLQAGQWPYPKFSDLWQYEPGQDNWIKRESLPFKNEELYALEGLAHSGSGYCFYENEFYEYNTIFDLWEKMANLNTNDILNYPHLFSFEEYVYVLEVSEYSDDKYFNMWSYAK